MFGKVKKWLGIEGVKLEMELPEMVKTKSKEVNGKLRFFTQHEATVTSVTVKMVERYSRGRNKEKLTDEYIMGTITMKDRFVVPENEVIELDFQLPFEISKSEMDELEDRNILFGGLVKTAKWIRGVKSEFRIEAQATVSGTSLDPFAKNTILLE